MQATRAITAKQLQRRAMRQLLLCVAMVLLVFATLVTLSHDHEHHSQLDKHQCVLCQHHGALDKTLISTALLFIFSYGLCLWLSACATTPRTRTRTHVNIRAPPQLH
jgi:hypothetical protein